MKKELFTKYLQDEIEAKKNLLVKNELSDEDKAAVQNSIDNLTGILERVEQSDDEEGLMELKNTVNDLNDKLTAIEEKIQQNKTEVNKDNMDTQEYLKSQNSLHDFADAIRNAKNANEFRKNWNDKLVANGFTITEGSESAFIPEAVKGQINDIWDRNADWLVSLTNTGAKRFYCRYNTSDQTAENSRAKGWKKGTEKSVQTINLASKLLEAQFVYKIQSIDLQTRFESDEALITYILNELVDQILYEIKRAILVGDGRDAGSNYKISKLEAIAKSSTDAYTTVSTVTANGFLVDDFRTLVDNIHNPNGKEVFVFMDKASLRTLSRVQASETSTPVYLPTEQVAAQIGATRIITTDLLGSTYTGIAMIPSEYYLVGENITSPILYTWHEGLENCDYWRYECVVGGGINGLKSTAVLKAE